MSYIYTSFIFKNKIMKLKNNITDSKNKINKIIGGNTGEHMMEIKKKSNEIKHVKKNAESLNIIMKEIEKRIDDLLEIINNVHKQSQNVTQYEHDKIQNNEKYEKYEKSLKKFIDIDDVYGDQKIMKTPEQIQQEYFQILKAFYNFIDYDPRNTTFSSINEFNTFVSSQLNTNIQKINDLISLINEQNNKFGDLDIKRKIMEQYIITTEDAKQGINESIVSEDIKKSLSSEKQKNKNYYTRQNINKGNTIIHTDMLRIMDFGTKLYGTLEKNQIINDIQHLDAKKNIKQKDLFVVPQPITSGGNINLSQQMTDIFVAMDKCNRNLQLLNNNIEIYRNSMKDINDFLKYLLRMIDIDQKERIVYIDKEIINKYIDALYKLTNHQSKIANEILRKNLEIINDNIGNNTLDISNIKNTKMNLTMVLLNTFHNFI